MTSDVHNRRSFVNDCERAEFRTSYLKLNLLQCGFSFSSYFQLEHDTL